MRIGRRTHKLLSMEVRVDKLKHVRRIASAHGAIATSILGEIKGFLRNDGTFIISKVPSGSYVVDILNPNYLYEPVRVEINNKGKFRARKVNVSEFLVIQVS